MLTPSIREQGRGSPFIKIFASFRKHTYLRRANSVHISTINISDLSNHKWYFAFIPLGRSFSVSCID